MQPGMQRFVTNVTCYIRVHNWLYVQVLGEQLEPDAAIPSEWDDLQKRFG